MKTLAGIPAIYNADLLADCHQSLLHNGVDCLFIDNNAEGGVKEYLKDYNRIVNKTNMYVNHAWNQIMSYFLDDGSYDCLLIVNSDIVVCHWLREWLATGFDDAVYNIPYINPVRQMKRTQQPRFETKDGHVPGVCIALSREQVAQVYPIPPAIKLWFGDTWITQALKASYRLMIDYDFQVYHVKGGSRSLLLLDEACAIIEQDKIEWAKLMTQQIQANQ